MDATRINNGTKAVKNHYSLNASIIGIFDFYVLLSENINIHIISATLGGKDCEGGNIQHGDSCSTACCPEDCVWASWGPWESCSVSCGEGHKISR